jgi:hypothetical protein
VGATGRRPRRRRARGLGGDLRWWGWRLRGDGGDALHREGLPDRTHGRDPHGGNGGTRGLGGWPGGARHRRGALGRRAVTALMAGRRQGRGIMDRRGRPPMGAPDPGRRCIRPAGLRGDTRGHVHVLSAQSACPGEPVPAERACQGHQEQQQRDRPSWVWLEPSSEADPHAEMIARRTGRGDITTCSPGAQVHSCRDPAVDDSLLRTAPHIFQQDDDEAKKQNWSTPGRAEAGTR